MLARAHLLLPFAALCGCFADGGFGSGPTGGPGEPGSSTSPSSTTTTTTADPTTAAPTTAAPTTDEPTTAATTTTTTGTTGAPACPGPAICEPGVVETIGPCASCGRLSRTCQEDCQWGPETCTESATGCGYWYFEQPDAWFHITPQNNAPTKPAVAAFELSQHGTIFVLTADDYQRFEPLTNTWSAPEPIAALLPGIPEPILLAYAVWNADGQFYDIAAIGAETAYLYKMNPNQPPAAPADQVPCCTDWTPEVPDPGLANVRDIFLDLNNPFGWAKADITALCQLNDTTELSVYGAWVLPDRVLVQDVGHCFKMVYETPYAAFHPFGVPGAPPGQFVGGTALLDGKLYVFAGD